MAGCVVPGVGTLLEKSVIEMRGPWGEARELQPMPLAPVLDRFRKVKVARVERATEAGPMPIALPNVVEGELRTALRETNLFPGGAGPTLVIRTRLTAHWTASGLETAVGGGRSEVVARVEFAEDGRRMPIGIYYIRGISAALTRKSDEALGRGLAAGVIEVIESRRTPSPAPPEPTPRESP
jgi:hypothetical protein